MREDVVPGAVAGGRPESGWGERLSRAALRLLLASAVLIGGEVLWLSLLGYGWTGERLLALAAALTTLVLLAEVVLGSCHRLGVRLLPAHAPWVVVVFVFPLLLAAADALFAGAWIRAQPGVIWMKSALLLLLVLAVRVAVGLYARLSRPAAGRRVGVALLLLFGTLLAGWVDATVLVGQYPAFHFLLAAAAVFSADMLARVLLPRGRPLPARLGAVGAVAVAAAALATVRGWDEPSAMHLASYSPGLLPKFREAVVRAANPARVLAKERLGVGVDGVGDGGPRVGMGERGAAAGGGAAAGNGVVSAVSASAVSAVSAVSTSTTADGGARYTDAGEVRGADGADGGGAHHTGADGLRAELVVALLPESICPDEGHGWWAPVPGAEALASTSDAPERSRAVLLEDGRALGPANARHAVVRGEGGGAFSHWQGGVYFSVPDGSDPRGNGRRYELRVPGEAAAGGHGAPASAGAAGGTGGVLGAGDPEARDFGAGGAGSGVAAAHGGHRGEFTLRPTPGPEAAAIRAATRNVLFVILDAVRGDHVGPRDGAPSLTPHIDALAARGVRFSTAYSPSDQTGRSVPALVTSLPLPVVTAAAENELPLDTWLAQLARAGFATFQNGSDYVFRKYDHVRLPAAHGAAEQGLTDSDGDGLEHELLAFATRQGSRPFAALAHWSDAHVGRTRDQREEYARGVSRGDTRLGHVLDGLAAAGLLHHTLVVVTADHGYLLGEDNRWLGGHGTSEAQLRVPLVLSVPGLARPGRVLDVPVSAHALAATVLDVLLPDADLPVWRQSLLPLLLASGESVEPRAQDGSAASASGALAFAAGSTAASLLAAPPVFAQTNAARMLRAGPLKLVRDDGKDLTMLYDLRTDPGEREGLFDAALSAPLLEALADADARGWRLVGQLVAGGRADLPATLVQPLLAPGLSARDVAAVLARRPELDDAGVAFVLATVVRRGLRDAGPALAAGLSADDARVLAVRAWTGDVAAAEALAERLPELAARGTGEGSAAAWLVELLVEVPSAAARPLVGELLEWCERLGGIGVVAQADDAPAMVASARAGSGAESPVTLPPAGSDDERTLALLARGLARQLGPATPDTVEDVLAALFTAWSVDNPGPSFSTLVTERFTRRELLWALHEARDEDDFARLAALPDNRDAAIVLPRIALDVGGERAEAFVLELLRGWETPWDPDGEDLGYVVATLERWKDEEFRAEAARVLGERFPRVRGVR